jgi:hypothetical protein
MGHRRLCVCSAALLQAACAAAREASGYLGARADVHQRLLRPLWTWPCAVHSCIHACARSAEPSALDLMDMRRGMQCHGAAHPRVGAAAPPAERRILDVHPQLRLVRERATALRLPRAVHCGEHLRRAELDGGGAACAREAADSHVCTARSGAWASSARSGAWASSARSAVQLAKNEVRVSACLLRPAKACSMRK